MSDPTSPVASPSLTQPPAQPPIARRDPTPTTLHGVTLQDDYRWMRDKDSPEVLAYLEAENAYTASVMAPTADLQAKLYAEMLSHIKETDETVPYRLGDWFYSTRTVEGSQYAIHCRRRATNPDLDSPFDPTQPEQVILDVNQLAEGKPFMAVGGMAISPDGNLLAYSTDSTGFRQYTLHIRDLRTGADLPDTAERVGSLAWAADSQHPLLLHRGRDHQAPGPHLPPHPRRARRRRYRRLPRAGRALQPRHRQDPRRPVPDDRSRQPHHQRVPLPRRRRPHRRVPPHRPAPRRPGVLPRLIATASSSSAPTTPARTSASSPRRSPRPAASTGPNSSPSTPTTRSKTSTSSSSFAVATRRKLGLPTLDSPPLQSDAAADAPALDPPVAIAFPEPTYSAAPHVNRIFSDRPLPLQLPVAGLAALGLRVQRRQRRLRRPHRPIKAAQAAGGPRRLRPALYASERVWIDAPDDVEGPTISIVYRRDRFRRDATNPLYVYGYGSYGYPLPVGFSPSRLSLLDRGVVMVYAHIRGGGELGDAWHDAGKMQLKRNTFTDFIAATEQLTARGYGDPNRVAIEGGSAGGLLMGAVVNMRPDLFRVVLSHVPFVDIMNTMLDASLPLTVAEYEEWGNPNEPEAFATMLSYSPYDNLEISSAGAPIPAMLVKTSLNDSQVMYWEPAKYVARLRTLKTNATPLLLHINMDAGHGGASGRYDYLKEIAFDYAFLLTQLGVEKTP